MNEYDTITVRKEVGLIELKVLAHELLMSKVYILSLILANRHAWLLPMPSQCLKSANVPQAKITLKKQFLRFGFLGRKSKASFVTGCKPW
jgi:hypothetical protein